MRVARVMLVAALLLGACNGSDEETLPPRPSSTTEPDYSVPAVIDVAYVEKVMAALDHVYGDGIRTLAREHRITQEFLEHLVAIYGDRFFKLAQQAWASELAEGAPNLKQDPGDPRTVVTGIRRAEPTCVVAEVTRDFSQVRATQAATPQRFIGLIPRAAVASDLNATPWLLAYDGWTSSGDMPSDPCTAS